MFTTDAHCDTLYQIAICGTKSDACTVTPERLRNGNVGLQTFAMYTNMERPDPFADGEAMLETYKHLPMARWDGFLPDCPPDAPSAVLSIEGGEMLNGRMENLARFDDEAHVRLIALTWNYENEIGTPAAVNADAGLKPFGRDLLREMDNRGICADVSHLNEAGFWDVMELAEVPPVASHSNCRWLCNVPRNLNKEQVRAIIDRKGFIGINFFAEFLADDREACIEDVLNNIDAICELGGEDVVGFGSDFDGILSWPEGLAHPGDFPGLLDRLSARGYSRSQVEKIAGLNYWRVLKTAESYRR